MIIDWHCNQWSMIVDSTVSQSSVIIDWHWSQWSLTDTAINDQWLLTPLSVSHQWSLTDSEVNDHWLTLQSMINDCWLHCQSVISDHWLTVKSTIFFSYACHEPYWSASKQRLHLRSVAGISRPALFSSVETTVAKEGQNPVARLWGRTLGESWPPEPSSSYAFIDLWCEVVASRATAASWMSIIAMMGWGYRAGLATNDICMLWVVVHAVWSNEICMFSVAVRCMRWVLLQWLDWLVCSH